ncbi:MAG: DNA invertase Pin-like site-specific DNA recombinase [Sulfitobacter sp.]|jgi:DNA invertase Pin-like site-specific DNA recombinase
MARIGYQGVSTVDQTSNRQELGEVDRLFEDKATGGNADRPALNELLAYIRPNDEVVVFSIDRLARNLRDLEDIIREVNGKGATVSFLTERLTFSGTDDAMSVLMLQMMGSFAQFERTMIRKRQAEGIAVAKNRGIYKGRKPSIDRKSILDMLQSGSSVTAIAKALGISRQSVYRIKGEVGA